MRNPSEDIFSPKRLLSALLALASLTMGIIVWDAERFISKQDEANKEMGKVQTSISLLVNNVGQLQISDSKQWAKLADHDTRITRNETILSRQ